jgi:hypothetical protein
MKPILALLLALLITTGLPGKIIAAADTLGVPAALATTGPNDPPFGSQEWWDREGDRG